MVKARRSRYAPRLESLETRALLSGTTTGEIFVRFNTDAPASATETALSTLNASVVQSYPDGSNLLSIGSGVDVDYALDWLKSDPYVNYAEENGTVTKSAVTIVTPNDPSYGSQWPLTSSTAGIFAPQAWGITEGNSNVIVAVLDTGLDLNNAEFAGRLWSNPTANKDGYLGDYNGWNFAGNNSNLQDYDGHGTHVTGILAATGNNGNGIVGVNWYARIMVVKVLDNSGNGTTDAAVSGIYFAVQHGAKVINASWGGGSYSQAMLNAISYANSQGVVFVTAAGNNGANDDAVPNYPGSYGLPNEIVVAATDSSGNLASFSDYGASTVDIAAPGVNIYSTLPSTYGYLSGTSMATPYVSAVVAMVAGLQPGYNAQQLVQRIIATATPKSSLAGKMVSGGILNAYNALNFSTSTTAVATVDPNAFALNGSRSSTVLAKMLATDTYYENNGGTATAFVTALYRDLLGRTPDSSGLAAWTNLLQSGKSRFDLIVQFQKSPEYLINRVAFWYQDLLGWTTPLDQLRNDSGVKYWASLLASGQSDNAVIARMLTTTTYFASQGGTDADYIDGVFESLFGRAADAGSLSYFEAQFASGMSRIQFVSLLETTTEAKRTTVARWYIEDLGWTSTLATLKNDSGVQYWAGYLGNT
ncbi:S8 family serine peptidase [Singulisphaera sp. PoT]|uniref:S8 family serine peptidase n=1 Tax=Singulisphaera sp. PoT TaxID=3411797 RepID=UPI003BF4E2C7